MRSFSGLLAVTFCLTVCAAARQDPLKTCRQIILVTTDSWSSPNGTMWMFERAMLDSNWQRRGSTIPVVVGRAGLAWGRGLIDTSSFQGPIKKEADDKAPAGIFRLGSVFGWLVTTKMPFTIVSPNSVCIDDSGSRYYNELIDKSVMADLRDWHHAEPLYGVNVYKVGIIVEHNVPPQPGSGSCIFLHVWKNPATPTSGCTAMSEHELRRVIRWLDPALAPLLVQLPRPVYEQLRDRWRLPKL